MLSLMTRRPSCSSRGNAAVSPDRPMVGVPGGRGPDARDRDMMRDPHADNNRRTGFGGHSPLWSRDGRSCFSFLEASDLCFHRDRADESFRQGNATEMFDLPPFYTSAGAWCCAVAARRAGNASCCEVKRGLPRTGALLAAGSRFVPRRPARGVTRRGARSRDDRSPRWASVCTRR